MGGGTDWGAEAAYGPSGEGGGKAGYPASEERMECLFRARLVSWDTIFMKKASFLSGSSICKRPVCELDKPNSVFYNRYRIWQSGKERYV